MRVMMERWFPYYGVPDVLITDRAQGFRSEFAQEFSKQYDIKIHHTSAYHPQPNAKVERVNRDLGNYLRLYVEQKSKWCDDIPGFVYCHNITPRDGEKYSPAYLLFVQELNTHGGNREAHHPRRQRRDGRIRPG